MVFRRIMRAALCAWALGWGATAWAGLNWPLLPGAAYTQRHPAYQPDNPNYQWSCPGHREQPAYGQYPWYGRVWGVPAYNWGYFGAPSSPSINSYKTYYQDFLQWGQWRRY